MGIIEADVEFARHALEQMQERGISTAEVLRTLQRGAKLKQEDGLLAVHGGIGVAYRRTRAERYKVKTVMWL